MAHRTPRIYKAVERKIAHTTFPSPDQADGSTTAGTANRIPIDQRYGPIELPNPPIEEIGNDNGGDKKPPKGFRTPEKKFCLKIIHHPSFGLRFRFVFCCTGISGATGISSCETT